MKPLIIILLLLSAGGGDSGPAEKREFKEGSTRQAAPTVAKKPPGEPPVDLERYRQILYTTAPRLWQRYDPGGVKDFTWKDNLLYETQWLLMGSAVAIESDQLPPKQAASLNAAALRLVKAGIAKMGPVSVSYDRPPGWKNLNSQIHELQYVAGCLQILALQSEPDPSLVAPLARIVDWTAGRLHAARDKYNQFGVCCSLLYEITGDKRYADLVRRTAEQLRDPLVWDTETCIGTVWFRASMRSEPPFTPRQLQPYDVSHANREAAFWWHAHRALGEYGEELRLLRNTFRHHIWRPTDDCPWAIATWIDGRMRNVEKNPRDLNVPGLFFGWYYVVPPELAHYLIDGWLFSDAPEWRAPFNSNTNNDLGRFCTACWALWLHGQQRRP